MPPIRSPGFVASLAHPGGNITGLANSRQEMCGKWLQLLKTAIPGAERIASCSTPATLRTSSILQAARQAAQTLRTELLSVEAALPTSIDGAFATMTREHAEALIVAARSRLHSATSRIVELAASRKLPAIYQFREFAAVGGLMSYGRSSDLCRRAATYVDKILKGAKPADLPVEQPTKFELVVNLKTAKALGLTIPPSILARADEVIE